MEEKIIIITTNKELKALFDGFSSDNRNNVSQQEVSPSRLLSLKEAAAFLKLAPQTIYGYTSRRVIAFLKRGKKLYFKQSDLEEWVEQGRRKSKSEIEDEIKRTGNLKL